MKGKFITFEGGEGTGKTTIVNELIKYFDKKNIAYIKTREPGGIEIAEKIRDIILDKNNTKMDPRTEALLYAASRIQHLSERVIPALEEGKIVLCDRYLDSSLVYQGIARGLGIEKVMQINMFALDYLPDLTFFIDLEPSLAFKRINDNNREKNRLDMEKMAFHEMVYEGYKKISTMFSDRIVRIDGNREVEEILKDILFYIDKII